MNVHNIFYLDATSVSLRLRKAASHKLAQKYILNLYVF